MSVRKGYEPRKLEQVRVGKKKEECDVGYLPTWTSSK